MVDEMRHRHGLGQEPETLHGDVQHLINPIIGHLRLCQELPDKEVRFDWLIERLILIRKIVDEADREAHEVCPSCVEGRVFIADDSWFCDRCDFKFYFDVHKNRA